MFYDDTMVCASCHVALATRLNNAEPTPGTSMQTTLRQTLAILVELRNHSVRLLDRVLGRSGLQCDQGKGNDIHHACTLRNDRVHDGLDASRGVPIVELQQRHGSVFRQQAGLLDAQVVGQLP